MKKGLAFLLIFMQILTLTAPTAFAESDFPEFYRLIAEDDFSYDWGQTAEWSQISMSKYDYDGKVTGTGFKFNWSSSADSYEVPNAAVTYQIISGRKTISKFDPAPIYRALAEPISLSEGTYTVSYSVQARPANDSAKTALDFRFRVGSEDLFFGMKYNDSLTNIIPQMSVGGSTQFGTTNIAENTYYTFKLEIDASDDSEDALRLKAYPLGESEPADWNVEMNAEVSGKSVAWLGYAPCMSGNSSSRFTTVKFEYTNKALESRIREITEKSEPTDEELRFAYAKLSKYPEGSEKNELLSALNTKCDDLGMTQARYAMVSASTPEDGSTVKADETGKIKIEYDYLINEGGDFDVYVDGGIVESTFVQNENKIEITLAQPLGEGQTIRVVPVDVSDYKGDTVTAGIEYKTSIFPTINIKDGEKYGQGYTVRWSETDGDVYTATLDGEPVENEHMLFDIGNHVFYLKVQRGSQIEEKTFNVEVTPSSPPEARNLTLSGAIKKDAVLKASYEFYDENNDDEGESVVRLFAANNKIEDGEEITDRLNSQNEFTVTEDLFGKYVYFTVKPVSVAYPEEGAEECSARYAMPKAPSAQGVTISGSGVLGENLKVVYIFADENGDAEGETVIEWKNAITGKVLGYGSSIVLENIAKGSTVVAVVTPKSTEIPYVGESVESNAIIVTDKKVTSDNEVYMNRLIAEDNFDYKWEWSSASSNPSKPIAEYDYGGEVTGQGFKFNWSTSPDEYKAPTGGVLVYQLYSNRMTISNYSPTALYRAFENPINFSKDGVYRFKMTVAAVGTADSHKTAADFRFMIGSPKLYMGYKYDSSLKYIIPQLCIGGSVYTGSPDPRVNAHGFFDYVMEIETHSDGADTVRMKMYPNGSAEKASWDIVRETELSESFIEYIGYIPCQSDASSNRFCNVSVSYVNKPMYDLIAECAANADASAEDIRKAFTYLAYFEDGAEKDAYIAALSDICTANGYSNVKNIAFSESVPANNSVAFAHEIDEIELTYDYLLKTGGEFLLYENGALKDCITIIRDGKATVKPANALMRGAEYKLVPDGILDYKGDAVVGELTFRTSETPEINISDGGVYGRGYTIRYDEPAGVESTLRIKTETGDFAEVGNHYVLASEDSYIAELSSSCGGAVETRTISFRVETDTKPVADNVTITGLPALGGLIEGSYEFSDANSQDRESGSRHMWYRKTEDGLVKVGDGYSYIISNDDVNHYLLFSVIPMSDSEAENAVGDESFSEAFAAPFTPEASSLSILGEIKAGNKITPSYTYYDVNGDAESGTEVHWYLAENKTEAGTEISCEAESFAVEINESLFGKYLYFTVTPKNEVAPTQGQTVVSQRYLMPTAPTVSDVSISGTVKAGSNVTANYKYYDMNGDPEGVSEIVWKTQGGQTIGTGRTITLPSDSAGLIIRAEVTGVSEQIPTHGNTAVSAYVTVGASDGGGSGSGGGGGGGGGGLSGKLSGSVKETETPPAQDNDKNNTDVKEDGFSDIGGHWAESVIKKLEEQGIISKDDKFRPDDRISRAEFLALIMRGMKLEGGEGGDVFGDVTADDWFAGYVGRALELGLISEDTNFRPNDVISREEAAKIVVNIMKIALDGDLSAGEEFEDFGSVSQWAKEYVAAAKKSGLFSGDENGFFNPLSSLKRAEAAVLTDRLMSCSSEAQE